MRMMIGGVINMRQVSFDENTHTHTHTHTQSERRSEERSERGREGGREGGRERERETFHETKKRYTSVAMRETSEEINMPQAFST